MGIDTGAALVGREPELARLREVLSGSPLAGAVVLAGAPGIGKTALWEAGIDTARAQGFRVLAARATGAETRLPFAGLIDLLDGVDDAELSGLPQPQLHALRTVLLRETPSTTPTGPGVVAVGLLNALRLLAADRPPLVAIDDLQWLDPQTAEALTFAVRRLDRPIGFLLSARPGSPAPLAEALARAGVTRVEVGPLGLNATRRMLAERLGLALRRPTLLQLHRTTLGNPLFALEAGRVLAARPPSATGDDVPRIDAVEDLLDVRIDRLAEPVRRLLLAVALSGELHTSEAAAIGGLAAIEDGVDVAVLSVAAERVRASHPLLAGAVKRRCPAADRRALHTNLADVVGDPRLRLRHRVLAANRPDAALAATAETAGHDALARRAWHEARELAEHALRLTPLTSTNRPDRLLLLADCLEGSGEEQRLIELLTPELGELPVGLPRVRAHMLLSEAGVTSISDLESSFAAALTECRGDPVLRARVLAKKASYEATCHIQDLREVERWARDVLPAARVAGPEVERTALFGLGWARGLRGLPIDDLCARFHAVSQATSPLADTPERVAGQRQVWRGDVIAARATFRRFLGKADEYGEPFAYALYRLHLCEAELRAGDWAAATRLLDEWAESAEGDLLMPPMYERCRALAAAGRGIPDDAERWAARAVAKAQATGVRWDLLEAGRAAGTAALLRHDPAHAAEKLGAIWDDTKRQGVDEPGVFPVAPDLVEALVELGRFPAAQAVAARLRELAEDQKHPWGLATADRCDAILRLASEGYADRDVTALRRVAADYEALGLRFDGARTLLCLGRAMRRHRKWAAARAALTTATTTLDDIGSAGWAAEARAELDRLGARRPRGSRELTPSERRVVALAVQGRTNRQIAQTLFVTVHTVEAHLSHAYAKLGVRSRTQLARLDVDRAQGTNDKTLGISGITPTAKLRTVESLPHKGNLGRGIPWHQKNNRDR